MLIGQVGGAVQPNSLEVDVVESQVGWFQLGRFRLGNLRIEGGNRESAF